MGAPPAERATLRPWYGGGQNLLLMVGFREARLALVPGAALVWEVVRAEVGGGGESVLGLVWRMGAADQRQWFGKRGRTTARRYFSRREAGIAVAGLLDGTGA